VTLQAKLAERSSQLQQDNSSLILVNEKLKEEKVQLEAVLLAKTAATQVADSHTIHELQLKMFTLQEELTELHRYR
jgi:autophagy-related protein 16